jgi:glycosyltransferase involved in cell wall biosynthesis
LVVSDPRSRVSTQRLERTSVNADLSDCQIGIDARYLKRAGVGISRYLEAAIDSLARAGGRLTLLIDDERHRRPLELAHPTADVVVLACRSGFFWEQHTVRRHLTLAGYDVYLAPANYGIPLTYRGPTRLVLIVHDLIPLRLPRLYLLPHRLWAVKYLASIAAAAIRADEIIAVSRSTAHDVESLLRRRVRDVVYPPLPVAPDERPADDGAGAYPALPALVSPYFVYNGGADPRKNVPTLLRALAQARSAGLGLDLVIIGDGYSSLGGLIERLGLRDRVHLLGHLDEGAKSAVLRRATALVYPSLMEGFGLPLVEGLANGIPVVSGTGGALREVGGDAVSYVAPLTVDALAGAMIDATADRARQAARIAGPARLTILQAQGQAAGLAQTIGQIVCSPLSSQ